MPWTTADAGRHNKAAGKDPRKAAVWTHVANATLRRTGDEGRAIREANAAADRVGKVRKGR